MSEKHDPVFNPLSWTLILLLAGLYALYSWYNGTIRDDLTTKQAELTETSQLLADTDARLGSSEQTIQGLHGEIDTLTAQYRQQEQGLTGELETAKQGIQALQSDMEALRTEHATTLAAEAQKASQAYAELQGRHDAANQQIAALGTEIEQTNQAMADAIAQSKAEAEQAAAGHQAQLAEASSAHQASLQEQEQQLNGRVSFYRTALEGSDPERADQMVSLDEQLQSNQQAIEQLEQSVQELEESKAALTEQLSSAEQTIQEREEVLVKAANEHKALLGKLAEQQSEQAALQTKYEETVAQAVSDLEAASQELNAEQQAHAQTRTAAAAALASAKQEAADTLTQAQVDAASAMETAKAEAAATLQASNDDAAAMLAKAQDEASNAMNEIKAAHASVIAEAAVKVESLNENLGNKHAALLALQQKHESMAADLNDKLTGTEQTLAGVEADLSAATQQAANAKAAYEKQVSELEADIEGRKSQIADLEQTLEQAKNDAVALQAAGEKALTDQRALYQQFSELGGRQTEQGMLLSLAHTELQFAANQANLPEELPSVDKVAALLVEQPKLQVRIEGHTDSAGPDEINLELSQKRADAVKQALIDRGVAAERLTSEGLGEARPIADNNSGAGRRQNRRVEIYVVE